VFFSPVILKEQLGTQELCTFKAITACLEKKTFKTLLYFKRWFKKILLKLKE